MGGRQADDLIAALDEIAGRHTRAPSMTRALKEIAAHIKSGQYVSALTRIAQVGAQPAAQSPQSKATLQQLMATAFFTSAAKLTQPTSSSRFWRKTLTHTWRSYTSGTVKLVSGAAEADDLGVDTQPEGPSWARCRTRVTGIRRRSSRTACGCITGYR